MEDRCTEGIVVFTIGDDHRNNKEKRKMDGSSKEKQALKLCCAYIILEETSLEEGRCRKFGKRNSLVVHYVSFEAYSPFRYPLGHA